MNRSFDDLEVDLREIFLDIACFLAGKDMRVAYYMWLDSGFSPYHATEHLCYQSLVKVGINHKLQMHYLLRTLGRDIVRMEKSTRTRKEK